MKSALLDANVILRYLTKDPPDMAEAAYKLFKKAGQGQITLVIPLIAVAEVVWVLESFYKFPKETISETVSDFLLCEGLSVNQLDLLLDALTIYRKKNLDFADALISMTALRQGPLFVYSFDRHFDRVEGITRLKP
jgi:uncharacterized protein